MPCLQSKGPGVSYAEGVKSDSNKAINRVTKRILKPLGFVRHSDRYWHYDGGWWLARLNFEPSAWSKGSYGEVALQCLLTGTVGWIWNGVDSPKRRVDLEGDEAAFEIQFEAMLRGLLPIALELVNKIHSPQEFIDHLSDRNLMDSPDFYKGMLLGLAGDSVAAKAMFQQILLAKKETDYELADLNAAKVAIALLPHREHFLAFADYIVHRSRSVNNLANLGPNGPRFPWRH